jgi:deoxyadenosine/deoxycytidine kinase
MPFVIYLECSKETMIKRIQKRANESEELRNDDNMEVLVKRF